jgi:hypothetical protein
MMERSATDRRPGMAIPAPKPPPRPPRFEHLSRSGRRRESLLTSYPVTLAALLAVTLLYALDACLFDGTYASTAWRVLHQVRHSFNY